MRNSAGPDLVSFPESATSFAFLTSGVSYHSSTVSRRAFVSAEGEGMGHCFWGNVAKVNFPQQAESYSIKQKSLRCRGSRVAPGQPLLFTGLKPGNNRRPSASSAYASACRVTGRSSRDPDSNSRMALTEAPDRNARASHDQASIFLPWEHCCGVRVGGR